MSALLSLLSAAGLFKLYGQPLNSLLFAAVFLGCLVLYSWINRNKLLLWHPFSMILSLVLAAFLVVGHNLFKYSYGKTRPFLLVQPAKSALGILGIGLLFWAILGALSWFSQKHGFKEPESAVNPFARIGVKRDPWLLFFGLLLLCYLPYYLAFFPGILTNDSTAQWAQAIGQVSLSNHHPVLHTLLMRLCLWLAGIFGGGATAAAALFSAGQVLFMAAVFATVLRFLTRLKLPRWVIFLAILYYAVNPLHGYYSVTHWKDIPFALVMTLLALQLIVWVRAKDQKISARQLLAMALTLLACAFLRNNGLYIMIIMVPVLIFLNKTSRKSRSIVLLSVLALSLLIQGPGYRWLGIEKSEFAESLAVPLQQIGRIAATGAPLTEEQKADIEQVIPLSDLKASYKNFTANPIKFHKNFQGAAIDENKGRYLSLWGTLVLENPIVATEAFLSINYGFWYPEIGNWSVGTKIYNNKLGLSTKSLAPDIQRFLLKLDPYELIKRELPFAYFVFGVGMMFWSIVLAAFMIWSRRKIRDILILLPFIILWGTLMIATPVFCETRYVYSLFCLLPLSVYLIFLRQPQK